MYSLDRISDCQIISHEVFYNKESKVNLLLTLQQTIDTLFLCHCGHKTRKNRFVVLQAYKYNA